MPVKYKIDVQQELKKAGYSTYRLRKEKLLPEATIQALREKRPISFKALSVICKLLNCQPGDIIEYEEDDQ